MTAQVLLSGAHGLIGSALTRDLKARGYAVHALARDDSSAAFNYDSHTKRVTLDSAVELDAVINLAGPSIADGRWTPARKRQLLESRRDLTSALTSALIAAPNSPSLFLSASAIGFYGASEQTFDEDSPAGDDFLASIGREWENAAGPAAAAGIRTAFLRFGVVLSTQGGVLGKLMLPFSFCAGGRLGSGSQRMSWIALPDVLNLVASLLETPAQLNAYGGVHDTVALNLVAGEPVTNQAFTRALGKALKRPTPFPLPSVVIGLLFGEMGQSLLLGNASVRSKRLAGLNVQLQHSDIDEAVAHLVSARV